MHFSQPPWTFFAELSKNLARKRGNYLGVSIRDPYLEALFIHYLKKSETYRGYTSVEGKSIDSDWFDRNLGSLDLFSKNEPIVITKAEFLTKSAVERFIEDHSNVSRKLIFIYSSKSSFCKMYKKV